MSDPLTPQIAPTSLRALTSVTGLPPGNKFGSAPISTAPLSPALLGIQESFEFVFSAISITALKVPGVAAALSPTKIIDSCSIFSPRSTFASSPGLVATTSAFIFSSERVKYGAIAVTFKLPFCAAFLKRKKIIGDSSSGSKFTKTTFCAFSKSA